MVPALAVVEIAGRRRVSEAMIEPYNAVGLIPSFWGIRRREEIKHNIEHLKGLTKAAFWLSNLDIPVRLLAIPEGALMGFNDEVLDVDHADYARTCCIDIPGPETDKIGKLARQWNVFIMAQAKARHKDWKDRFFNIGFIVDPDGKIILQHYKLCCRSSARCRRTIFTIGGSRSTVVRSMRSGRSPIPRSGGSES
jgi:predicted amidohydrolase